MATRDANQVTVAMGSYNGVATPLKVDNTTGYLKISSASATLNAPTVVPTVAERDENQVCSALGTYNNAPKPLFVLNANGYLRVVDNA